MYEELFYEAAVNDEANRTMQTKLVDPIYKVLEIPANREKYISYGSEFLDANAEMLSKEYPTTRIVFPRKYVARVTELFGWTEAELKETLKEVLQPLKDKTTYQTFLATPTNFIHALVLFYV